MNLLDASIWLLEAGHQQPHGCRTNFCLRLRDHRQPRLKKIGPLEVVEAHQGDVIWHA
jgi:hypothetical protein